MFAALLAHGVERCHGGGISIPQIVDFHLQLGEFRSRDQLSAGVRFLDAQVRSLLWHMGGNPDRNLRARACARNSTDACVALLTGRRRQATAAAARNA